MEDTLQVVFRPARNGTGVICRLPNGKVAFPSRYHWKQAPPEPYEIWTVLPCGEIAPPAVPGAASVAYVKPVERLAEAPFRDTRAGRIGNSLLWRLGRFLALLVRLPRAGARQRARQAARPATDQLPGG